ncbi:L-threonylcarbamoyladenylate synthase [Luteococcus sp. Sow4_B9]|uniref:L-threonylcarbamoyladenylate synthase n=1 Tax=Luteococcus sp. Sow4_B9 TaxID=3438792 RepID=UPI003F9505C8
MSEEQTPVDQQEIVDAQGPVDEHRAADAQAVTDDGAPQWQRFDVKSDTSAALAAAQAAVAAGECIVLPTDTVYGIGANAFSAAAVQGLLDAKHRGRDMPPPVLVAEAGMLEALADDLPAHALRLAEKFWPGALTLIVPAQQHLRMDLGETRGTIAVRVPDHDFTRDLLRRTGPLAVSSANVSGQPSSTTIDAAVEQLGNSVHVYLDAGATPGSTPSTIVDFVSETLGRVVRMGAIGIEELREVNPFIVWEDEVTQDDAIEADLVGDDPAGDEPSGSLDESSAPADDETGIPPGEADETGQATAERDA